MKCISKLSKPARDSLSSATYIFAIIGTVASIAGISVRELLPGLSIWLLIILVLAIFLLLTALIRFFIFLKMKTGVHLKVNNNSVEVKVGDLFSCDGWKVIPFNEYYDTTVDNIVISKKIT